MAYAEELPEDRREHRKYHDGVVNGIPSRRLKSDQVVWESGYARLLVVRHRMASLNDRRRAERVAQLARLDTSFDFAAYHAGDSDDGRDPHVFLLEVNQRLVGILVAERREYVQRFTWSNGGRCFFFHLVLGSLLAMPRQARLDAPGTLHHVMVRGLERRPIFRDDADRRTSSPASPRWRGRGR